MSLNEWYEKGILPADYRGKLEDHKDGFNLIYNTFDIPNDGRFFEELKSKNLRVIVLAEPWCGHCMLNIPLLLRLTEKAELPVRILLRDENLELMDQYLTNGKSRSIPIFIFINENGEEVGKWGPIANYTKNFVDEHKVHLPEKDHPEYDKKFKEFITIVSKAFREREDIWEEAYKSIKSALQHM